MITKQKVNIYEVIGVEHPSKRFLTRFGRVLFYCCASYLALLTLNVLLSLFFGFSLTSNYISDLGSKLFIPFPYMHNLICVFGGVVSLPANFFVRKKLQITYTYKNSRLSALFAELGVALGVIGNVGYVLLGVFSSFAGYIFSIFFFSLNIVLSHKCNLRHLGLFGLVVPLSLLVLYSIIAFPLIEWFLLSSILAFLFLLNYYVFKL